MKGCPKAQTLEGLLEHLVIIPEETRIAADESNAHWSAVMEAKVRELPKLGPQPTQTEIVVTCPPF